jgi:cell division protease FtsH
MGGRVAEELTQDEITTGAGNDIERATELARRMVCEWGMSELGPLAYGEKDEPVFLGRELSTRTAYSEATSQQIDREVKRIVDQGYRSARGLLTEHREVLDRLAQELLEKESLDGKAVYVMVEEMTGVNVRPAEAPRARPSRPDDAEAKQTEPDEGAAASEEDDSPVGVNPGIVTA